MAIPPLDDFVTEQQRETQHWLNSTSTYYNIDWINEEKASKHYISRRNTSRVIIWAKTLAVSQRKFAKSEALVAEPSCLSQTSDGVGCESKDQFPALFESNKTRHC